MKGIENIPSKAKGEKLSNMLKKVGKQNSWTGQDKKLPIQHDK